MMRMREPTAEEIRERGEIGARMHPYDYELALQRLERMFKSGSRIKSRRVVPGGCIVIKPRAFHRETVAKRSRNVRRNGDPI